MSTIRAVTDWFQIIQNSKDDLRLANHILDLLDGYESTERRGDLNQLINAITAIRLDQMAKENHHGT